MSPGLVARMTRAHGPFPVRYQRTPSGLLVTADLAHHLGIATPTIVTWREKAPSPPPISCSPAAVQCGSNRPSNLACQRQS